MRVSLLFHGGTKTKKTKKKKKKTYNKRFVKVCTYIY